MPTPQLRWITSASASTLHAAHRLLETGSLADRQLAEALREPAEACRRALDAAGLNHVQFWLHAVPLAAGIENNRQLAELLLRKLAGRTSEAGTAELAACIAALENAAAGVYPRWADDLLLRIRPLSEQWDARGPGLMHRIGQITEPELLVEEALVIGVHPVAGGGGVAHLPYNSVRIEAVLANPYPELPEVLRLGWLLAQLHLDLPRHSESFNLRELPRLAQLALLPPTLAAAEHVDLARESDLKLALNNWLGATSEQAAAWEPALRQWWEAYVDLRPAFRTALEGLAQLLPAGALVDAG